MRTSGFVSTVVTGLALLASSSAAPTTTENCKTGEPDRAYKEAIAVNYINSWNGDFDLGPQVFAPDVHLYQDRYPTKDGVVEIPVNSQEEFTDFQRRAHDSWNSYMFERVRVSIDGLNVVIRYKQRGIMGPNFSPSILTTLKEGQATTYNGTDWLQLDPCSWLIKQVDSSQDLITYSYILGLPDIKLH
ncbi:hypothetical protein PT974_07249 [Cladobotryum mycophilum]|uniref:SnoaL-like domain-containing protein n=1 Tax=Cladobotryum mycophilum TaxID=491253 RepID=A0ABR0SPI8_9HYPO